ncbi:MAG: hypothetical protein DHS80DRAFT_24732 [Piptocephalis tieghemiana]|nr:MAG: hypothetical protein DHS80DRAFT_24732 [Piptocephalis tieghemiana]
MHLLPPLLLLLPWLQLIRPGVAIEATHSRKLSDFELSEGPMQMILDIHPSLHPEEAVRRTDALIRRVWGRKGARFCLTFDQQPHPIGLPAVFPLREVKKAIGLYCAHYRNQYLRTGVPFFFSMPFLPSTQEEAVRRRNEMGVTNQREPCPHVRELTIFYQLLGRAKAVSTSLSSWPEPNDSLKLINKDHLDQLTSAIQIRQSLVDLDDLCWYVQTGQKPMTENALRGIQHEEGYLDDVYDLLTHFLIQAAKVGLGLGLIYPRPSLLDSESTLGDSSEELLDRAKEMEMAQLRKRYLKSRTFLDEFYSVIEGYIMKKETKLKSRVQNAIRTMNKEIKDLEKVWDYPEAKKIELRISWATQYTSTLVRGLLNLSQIFSSPSDEEEGTLLRFMLNRACVNMGEEAYQCDRIRTAWEDFWNMLVRDELVTDLDRTISDMSIPLFPKFPVRGKTEERISREIDSRAFCLTQVYRKKRNDQVGHLQDLSWKETGFLLTHLYFLLNVPKKDRRRTQVEWEVVWRKIGWIRDRLVMLAQPVTYSIMDQKVMIGFHQLQRVVRRARPILQTLPLGPAERAAPPLGDSFNEYYEVLEKVHWQLRKAVLCYQLDS